MLAMPLMFVLFVIRFPAGVMVYWITTNTWTMAQQYIIKRRIGPITPAAAGAGASTSVVATSGKSPPPKDAAASGSSTNGSGSRWPERIAPRPCQERRREGKDGRRHCHSVRPSTAVAAQEEEALRSQEVGVLAMPEQPAAPRPAAAGANRRGRRAGCDGRRRRQSRRARRRVPRRGSGPADRTPRADDRRDPAPRVPVCDAG